MVPRRTDGQCCPVCNSPYLLKLGEEWWCDTQFHSSPGFYPAACQAWIDEFARKDSFWLWLRHPFWDKFTRIASIWPAYTEEELRDIYTALKRIDAMYRYRDLKEREQWRRPIIPPSAWGSANPVLKTELSEPNSPLSDLEKRAEAEIRMNPDISAKELREKMKVDVKELSDKKISEIKGRLGLRKNQRKSPPQN